MKEKAAQPCSRCGPRELAVATVLCTGGLLGLLGLSGGVPGLFRRHFWLDEVLTFWLVDDPSIVSAWHALASGLDTNTPALYLLMKAFVWPLGGASEMTLRLFAFVAMTAGLVGAYVVMRGVVNSLAAATGVVMIASNPEVLKQTLDARQYNAWLALTVWFVWAYGHWRESHAPRWGWTVAALSVLVATVHYFGVISLAGVMVFEALIEHGRWRGRCLTASPLLAGVIALIVCASMLLPGQRHGLTVPTWLAPVSSEGLEMFTLQLFPGLWLLAPLLGFGVSSLIRPPALGPGNVQRIAGLVGLLTVPFVLMAISLFVQPAMLPRYSLVGVVGVGAVVAVMVEGLPRPVAIGVFLALGACGIWQSASKVGEQLGDHRTTADLIRDLRALPADALVAFDQRRELYPVWQSSPDLRERLRLMDFEAKPELNLTTYDLFERDMGRKVATLPDKPRLMRLSELKRTGRFYLIIGAMRNPDKLGYLFRDCAVNAATPLIFEVVPHPG